MVVIPSGRFLMGSPQDEPERGNNERQHQVDIARFAIGIYAVTRGEFRRFVEVTDYKTTAEGTGVLRKIWMLIECIGKNDADAWRVLRGGSWERGLLGSKAPCL